MPSRREMWERLGAPVDLLVVGGGVTGAGIARDAARRGLDVAVVDMADLASGTSSRSSKLIHGGLRYLEHYEFSLVFEAVSERRILQTIAPHLVNPLGFLFPVYRGQRHRLFVIQAGMWLYDGLSLFRSPRIHRRLSPADVAAEEPCLNRQDLKGAPLFYDCATDDARLTLETALDAADQGATVATYAKVVGFVQDEGGRIRGATVRDELVGREVEVPARVVINATGPWTDELLRLAGREGQAPLLRPTKGVHLVVHAQKLPLSHAVVCLHPQDGRVLFAIPWGDRTFLGTTDTDFEGDPATVAATSADVDYLIDASAAYFPDHPLTREDVISTWAGIRPLMAPPGEDGQVEEGQVSREHRILVGEDGMITIAGGKLTTYRRMARECVDTAVQLLELLGGPLDVGPARTDKAPLPGAVGWPEDDDHDLVARRVEAAAEGRLAADVAHHLGDTYGTRGIALARRVAEAPALGRRLVDGCRDVWAQVEHAVTEELASTVSDVMMRRTQLYYRAADQGLGVAAAVADVLQQHLGWSDEERDASLEAYRREVGLSRAWRSG
ncbi:MAG: glycerol-3-phosphate dehydrogenase [Sandaracinaceae bacterium]